MANLITQQQLTQAGIDRKLEWFASSFSIKYSQLLYLGLGAGRRNTTSIPFLNRLNSSNYTLPDFQGDTFEEHRQNAAANSLIENIDDIDNLQSEEVKLEVKNTEADFFAKNTNFKISFNKLGIYRNSNDLLGASDLILETFLASLHNHMDLLDKRVYEIYENSQENYYADVGTFNQAGTGNDATFSSNAPVSLGDISNVYRSLRKFIDENLQHVNSSSQDWIMKSFLANTMNLSSYDGYDYVQYREMWSRLMNIARPIMILPYEVYIQLNQYMRTPETSNTFGLLKMIEDIPYFVDENNRIKEQDITLQNGQTQKAVPIYFVSGSPFELFPRENTRNTTHVYLNNGVIAPDREFSLSVQDAVAEGNSANITQTKTSGFSIFTDTSGLVEPLNKKFNVETNFSILPYNNVKKLYIKL